MVRQFLVRVFGQAWQVRRYRLDMRRGQRDSQNTMIDMLVKPWLRRKRKKCSQRASPPERRVDACVKSGVRETKAAPLTVLKMATEWLDVPVSWFSKK